MNNFFIIDIDPSHHYLNIYQLKFRLVSLTIKFDVTEITCQLGQFVKKYTVLN